LGGMTANVPPVRHYKLVLLGDASVGKSCLVVRFAKGDFSEYQEPTIGAAFMTQSVQLPEQTVKFEIWDTAGQERYRSLAPMYYRGASAAVIVYDITSRDSFDGAKSWVHELQGVNRSDNLVIALAGNKADLAERKEREVDPEVAQAYAKDMGIFFLETSAKTGQNVKDVFEEIARRLPKESKEEGSNNFQVGKKGTEGGSWCCSA